MPFKRKKEPIIKKLFLDELFWFVIFFIGLVFIVGAPTRIASGFFYTLDFLHLGRIGAALIWIVLYLVIFILVMNFVIKELYWNNNHLTQDVIKIDLSSLRIFNHKEEITISISKIKKILIMNKDSTIKIEYKEKKAALPKHLEDNRKAFDSLKEILTPLNPDIEFFDSSIGLTKND